MRKGSEFFFCITHTRIINLFEKDYETIVDYTNEIFTDRVRNKVEQQCNNSSKQQKNEVPLIYLTK